MQTQNKDKLLLTFCAQKNSGGRATEPELIKKLTEGGGNLGNSDAVKSSGSNGNALPGRIDLEEQRKIMDAIERKRESSRSAIVSGAVASQTSSKRKLASESSSCNYRRGK